jgi:hypothetical protein
VEKRRVYIRTLQRAADATGAFLLAVDIVHNEERIATAQLKGAVHRERNASFKKPRKAG